ncbi:hypothetical protein BDV26DRAFT_42908 [Aspergillus bertholletiae]|uniref:Uncharacterized protein n=1 Tax=Aspergillus bertholletiae TaxID=1226010 RepID=A0A5N7AXL5_9EURO|nr:hypothetical protein BDV26DRAFT_42908 [Aspergillus bertholletiae]
MEPWAGTLFPPPKPHLTSYLNTLLFLLTSGLIRDDFSSSCPPSPPPSLLFPLDPGRRACFHCSFSSIIILIINH